MTHTLGMEDGAVVAHACSKTKMIISGMEGKNVVACGRLPYPAHVTRAN